MTAPRPDPLAGWRAARAARVATVATTGNAVATAATPQKIQGVASVASVTTESEQGCNARAAGGAVPAPPPPPDARDAWGLSDAERAAALARLEGSAPVPAPAPPPPPPEPLTAPPRPAVPWHAMPYGAERGRAFAEARRQPGACPHCAGRRWWRRPGTEEAPTCETCHPPPADIR